MASNRITEGVGKKIVDALKAQSDVEIHTFDETENVLENNIESQYVAEEQTEIPETNFDVDTDFLEKAAVEEAPFDFQQEPVNPVHETVINPEPVMSQTMTFNRPTIQEDTSDMDGFEIPTNVAVLKQLITKLPTGVTKQTGAQIIRQTMEALGISMKSVLQEAQSVQEGLSNSSRECQATIAEYKRQIGILEKQSLKYQRQYNALNDIISLFIQTNN